MNHFYFTTTITQAPFKALKHKSKEIKLHLKTNPYKNKNNLYLICNLDNLFFKNIRFFLIPNF